MFGVLIGLANGFCFVLTMKMWFTYSIRVPPQTQTIMHLLRSLLKVAACLSFTFTAVHVPGKNNGVADALSRF